MLVDRTFDDVYVSHSAVSILHGDHLFAFKTKVAGLLGITCLIFGCTTPEDLQTVEIITTPLGATCVAKQAGVVVGTVPVAPGTFKVKRSKEDLVITCSMLGFHDVTYTGKAHSPSVAQGTSLTELYSDWDNNIHARYDTPVKLILASLYPAVVHPKGEHSK